MKGGLAMPASICLSTKNEANVWNFAVYALSLCSEMINERADTSFFEQFFKENYSLFYFTAYHLLEDDELSRDIVGECVELLWRNRRSEDASEWRSFMYRSIRNKCIDHLRHEAVKKKYIAFYLAMTPEEEEDADEEEERIEMVMRRIDELPPLPRRVLEMCYFERKRYQEVADELQISTSYVKKLIMKALSLLRGNG